MDKALCSFGHGDERFHPLQAGRGRGRSRAQALIPAPTLLKSRLEANIWRLGWKVGVLELSLTGCTEMRAQMTDPTERHVEDWVQIRRYVKCKTMSSVYRFPFFPLFDSQNQRSLLQGFA